MMSAQTRYTAHAKALLVLGLPLVGSQIAQMLLHVIDTVLLGRYRVESLAAVVLGGSYFFMLFILGAGFGNAVMGMIATALGQRDEVQVRRDTRMALWLSLGFGVLVQPLFMGSRQVLVWLGQDPALAVEAARFLSIAGLGMIPALLVVVLRSFLSALERTQVVLWVTLASVGVNALLAWVLIFGRWGAPELGVRGAAMATVTVQSLGCLALALYAGLAPASRPFHLFHRFWRADWPVFLQVFRLGLPVGLTGLAESGLFIAAALMMGWVGTVPLAAHGIAMQIAAITFMVHMGLANATTVRAGRAFGEGDTAALGDVGRTAIVLSLGFAAVMVALFVVFPQPIVSTFTDATKPESGAILGFGVRLLYMAALFQVFDAMQVIALGLLRGVHDTRVPMWIAIFSYWCVGIPTSYVMAFVAGWGGIGLWVGLVIGLVAAAGLLMARFWTGRALHG